MLYAALRQEGAKQAIAKSAQIIIWIGNCAWIIPARRQSREASANGGTIESV